LASSVQEEKKTELGPERRTKSTIESKRHGLKAIEKRIAAAFFYSQESGREEARSCFKTQQQKKYSTTGGEAETEMLREQKQRSGVGPEPQPGWAINGLWTPHGRHRSIVYLVDIMDPDPILVQNSVLQSSSRKETRRRMLRDITAGPQTEPLKQRRQRPDLEHANC
jgi:hypothetical protein